MSNTPTIVAPIFVGGCDRSGTTMLGAMLGGHSKCAATPESEFKIPALARANAAPTDRGRVFALALQGYPKLATWSLPGAEARRAGDTPQAVLGAMFDQHLRAHDIASAGLRWVDHSPNNLRHAIALKALFTDAYFVHIVRDPRAIAASVMPLAWGPSTPEACGTWWAERVATAVAISERALAGCAATVRYEDLVTAPHDTLSTLCDELGLSLEEAQLNGGEVIGLPGYTRAQHTLVGAAPDPARIDRWRDRLSDYEVQAIEYAAGPMMDLMGYKRSTSSPTIVPPSWRLTADRYRELARREVVQRFRGRRRARTLRGR